MKARSAWTALSALGGLLALAGLRWADFIRLVLRAMHAAGYSTITDDGKPSDGFASDGKDILLKRGSQRTLALRGRCPGAAPRATG